MKDGPGRLGPLLAGEIARRIPTLMKPDADVMDVRAALHAIRGSAAMAGEHDLALVIGQLGARVRRGDASAREDAATLFTEVLERLRANTSPFSETWPVPPPMLSASSVDARYRSEYAAEMRARLEELDSVLTSLDPGQSEVEQAYRAVHSMKGAAMALGDDALVWYLHGLESALKKGTEIRTDASEALLELTHHRAVLAGLIEDPGRTLDSLRPPDPGRNSVAPEPPVAASPRRTTVPPPPAPEPEAPEAQLRVPGHALDRLLDRLDAIELVQDELRVGGETAQRTSEALRVTRIELIEALNLMGPARAWGAPVGALERIRTAVRTLSTAAQSASESAYFVRQATGRIHTNTQATRHEVAALRRTTVQWVFERVETAVLALAAREGKLVNVVIDGADVPLDRRVAERMLDSVLQVARNAVAHAIERPELRSRAGLSPKGVVGLKAERLGDWIRILVEDDGVGVDLQKVRKMVVEQEVLTEQEAKAAHEEELLALLFVPGLTTRGEPDLSAGRGVGLDLAQDVVRRLGGTIRLSHRPTGGICATLDVPSEAGMADVLWVEAGGTELALPVGFTSKVMDRSEAHRTVPLAECVGLASDGNAPYAIELDIRGVDPISVGVDRVGTVEDAVIRALPPIVASSGPFSGAILRGNGSLRLLLDAARLAARAWARTL